ncbi:winged helix-turn-helix domain-containing protein [Microvirga sp. 3-52]|nr:winged helix-turn-helix domain-containing protein [Microvirga sp. 3-52]MBS7454575.1 winged helix-turn-helix domain-containing protein [Microvirga sp. 3-52]
MADTVGLTLVHTNRMLQELQAEGLITLEGQAPDDPRLRPAGGPVNV